MDLQGILDRAVERGAAPGFTAAVRFPGGKTVAAAAGRAGAEANTPPLTPHTRMWIASCTKAIVSVAALRMVEQGLLDLDAPLGESLAALTTQKVLDGFDEEERPIVRFAKANVTLRQLLSHTSGYAYDFCSEALSRWKLATGFPPMAGAPDLPLVFEPGEGWTYGIGIDVAALVMEAASGRTIAELIDAEVLAPLGMSETGFFCPPNAARASVSHKIGEAAFGDAAFHLPETPYFGMAGGGLWSTPADYLTFLDTVLAKGSPLISADTFAEMMRVQPGAEDGGSLKSSAPIINDFTPLTGCARGHGLSGLVNLEDVPGGRCAGSLTWAGLANCYYWADPASGVAGVLMAQVFPFADPAILSVFDEIETSAYA